MGSRGARRQRRGYGASLQCGDGQSGLVCGLHHWELGHWLSSLLRWRGNRLGGDLSGRAVSRLVVHFDRTVPTDAQRLPPTHRSGRIDDALHVLQWLFGLLPATAPFDAATALLVSQFILENAERREFFAQISAQLLPGGHLINTELALDASGLSGSSLFEVWLEMQRYIGVPEESVEKLRSVYGRDVAVSTPQQIEEMIASSGFEAPTQFFRRF